MLVRTAIALSLLLAAQACSKSASTDGEKAGGASLEAGVAFAIESGTESLVEVKAAMDKGDPESASFSCAAVTGFAESVKQSDDAKAEAFAAEATKVCGHDLPIATLEASLKKLADKGVKPDDASLDCVNPQMALEQLVESFPDDPKTRELTTRLSAHCSE